MAKRGMARPNWTHTKPRNDVPPVPELQGKAKSGKKPAPPIVSGTSGPELKVYHEPKVTGAAPQGISDVERPISRAYPVVDNDLARDNMENDIPAADLEDI